MKQKNTYPKIHFNLTLLFIVFGIIGAADLAFSQWVIEGKILNGSQDSSAFGNAAVTLHSYLNRQEVPERTGTTTADRSGSFRFHFDKIDSATVFVPSVTFQGENYFGRPVSFIHGGKVLATTVVVFDTTSNDSGIGVAMHHVFLEFQEKNVAVREILILQNSGTRAFIEKTKLPSGQRETLRFSLPTGATGVELLSGLAIDQAVVHQNFIHDTRALAPGRRQVSYRYEMARNAPLFNFARRVDYATALFDLFLSDSTLRVASNLLQPMGSFNIRGQSYMRYAASNLPAGTLLDIQVANLAPTQKLWSWLPLAGFGLLLIVGIVLYSIRRKPTSSQRQGRVLSKGRVSSLKKERETLIAAVADLDDQFEQKKIPESDYRNQREELKRKLLAVTTELEGSTEK